MIFFKKHINIFIFSILAGIAFFVFYKTLFFGFFSDDYHFLYITATQDSVWKYLFTNNVGEAVGGSYGPMLNIFFTIQYKLFGSHAFWYHAVTLISYVVTAFVIYLFSTRISKNKLVGFFSAVLFIFLHNHVEAISWIAVQTHIFATLFFMLGLYLYYVYVLEHRKWFYALAFIIMTISIFTKESAIMFLPILFLIEIFFCKSSRRNSPPAPLCSTERSQRSLQKRGEKEVVPPSLSQERGLGGELHVRVLRMIPFALMIIIFLVARFSVVGYVAGYYANQDAGLDLLTKAKMFVELSVNMIFSWPLRTLMSEWFFDHKIILGLCGLLILFVTHFASKKYRKQLWFLLLSYGLASLPFIFLMYNPFNDSGERYAYLVSIFFVMYVSLLLYGIFEKVTYGRIYFSILMIIFISFSYVQLSPKLGHWQAAGDVRDAIFNQFSLHDFKNNDFIVFVGLPDNMEGAEVMRNAIWEALYFESNLGYISGERLPFYIEPKREDVFKSVLTIEKKTENIVRLVPIKENDRVFTGFRTFEFPLVHTQMDNFQIYGNSGTGVTMTFDQDELEKYREQGKEVVLAYFDGKEMNFIRL
ncbi:MAG: glycosyltransferase family 39 protein [Candidatus Magasanikbacteria bacterium]|nr:glycosyltransferase family 39 protein [Candidatus Magasanikbacteria bacterium]